MIKFDGFLLNIVILIFPLMIYLLYTAYNKSFNKREDNLLFIITIFSQLYLIYKYGQPIYKSMPLFIIEIPLFLSYLKKEKFLIIISSIFNILYYYTYYEQYLLFIILEYIIYYIIYSIYQKKNMNYLLIICIVKAITIASLSRELSLYVLSEGTFLYVISVFVIYLLEKTEDMLKLHMTIKEIKHDEDIKTSLFRITHEIKNPIAVCKGYLDMYDENKIENFKKHIPILKEEIDRTLILLEDFLSMNKLKINKDIIDINLLLEEVVNNMNLLFIKNGIKIISKISDDEIYINGDYNRLTQVFVNILKNSIEALEDKKERKIKIWTEIDEKNIDIFIKDNGIGIPKKIINKIKEPFYTTKIKGTGLGVSLSEEIISAHKGEMIYESKENEYTLVIVKLPLEKAV